VADIIAAEKAYSVPAICSALGLLDGTETEAYDRKFRYAKKRFDLVEPDQLKS
jgi:hypothetical protein